MVAVALALGGAGLVAALHESMQDQIETTARLRADDVARALEAGRHPAEVVEVDDEDESFVQVIGPDGRVVAASEALTHRDRAVARLRPGHEVTIDDPTDDGDHDFMVVAVEAEVDDADFVVLVGQSTEIIETSTEAVMTALAIGIPLLVLLVGATTWVIVGRTLAPVEAIRREVDAISSDELYRRVPEPRTRDEIARLAATMNAMLGRLQGAQHTQRRFVSDASHELRSPVAAIRQHAEVAIAHPDTTTLEEFAHIVLGEDLRVQRLVEDLLFLARSDEGDQPHDRQMVDLDDLVFAEARRLRESGLGRVDVAGVSAVRVEGDPVRLTRVLVNLGDNARRHAAPTVRFTLTLEGAQAVCGVEDDGVGVPVADRERIFERFVRLDEARARDDGGSGLGLAIAAEIVGAHGGSISVGDSDLGGARFEVRLPSVPEA